MLQVIRPHTLDVPLAHMMKPLSNGAEAPHGKALKRQQRSAAGPLTVMLDAEGVLAEMHVMGAGLVESVLLRTVLREHFPHGQMYGF